MRPKATPGAKREPCVDHMTLLALDHQDSEWRPSWLTLQALLDRGLGCVAVSLFSFEK